MKLQFWTWIPIPQTKRTLRDLKEHVGESTHLISIIIINGIQSWTNFIHNKWMVQMSLQFFSLIQIRILWKRFQLELKRTCLWFLALLGEGVAPNLYSTNVAQYDWWAWFLSGDCCTTRLILQQRVISIVVCNLISHRICKAVYMR